MSARWPDGIMPMSLIQSVRIRRRFSAPAASPCTTTEKTRPGRWRGYVHAANSRLLALTGSLPPVDVGSGLPPSAQTRRSIISLSEEGAWDRLPGHEDATPCRAAHFG